MPLCDNFYRQFPYRSVTKVAASLDWIITQASILDIATITVTTWSLMVMEINLAGYLPSLIAIAISIAAVLVYTYTQEELIKLVSGGIALVAVVSSFLLANWVILTGLVIFVLNGFKFFPKEIITEL
ncbi:hypothetical protein [Arthrospira platensis]|nr:hypothetical protein [Arthrospira platensis PCC 7345]